MTHAIIIQPLATCLCLWYTLSDEGSGTCREAKKSLSFWACQCCFMEYFKILRQAGISLKSRALPKYCLISSAVIAIHKPSFLTRPGARMLFGACTWVQDPMCSTLLWGQRPLFSCHRLETWFASVSSVIHFLVLHLHRDPDKWLAPSTAHYEWKT